MPGISAWRFCLVPLEVRMWRWKACPRFTLPLAVFLKRLAAPLCVFILILGIRVPVGGRTLPPLYLSKHKRAVSAKSRDFGGQLFGWRCRLCLGRPLFCFWRSQDQMQGVAFLPCPKL